MSIADELTELWDRIIALQIEAARAGDTGMVEICDRALGGNSQSLNEIKRVLRDAEAQS